jgi:hypothetical protein
MRQFMMTMIALAALGAMVVTAQAENQTPSPPTVSDPVKKRTVSQNGRDAAKPSPADLGWDFAHPGRVGGFSELPGTCTGLKSDCIDRRMDRYYGRTVYFETFRESMRPYREKYCNFYWEQCMKTGFWEGKLIHRPAERR